CAPNLNTHILIVFLFTDVSQILNTDFVSYRVNHTTLRCDPVPEMRCPSTDWHEYGDFCYKPFTDLKTWHAARSECRKLEADLVSILSIAEQKTEKQYFCYDPVATGDVWTGLNDLEFQGFFTWSDQHEVQFTYWAPGEPNNHDGDTGGEDCVEMYPDGQWNDNNCVQKRGFACRGHQCKTLHVPAVNLFDQY
uniref:C-type lectin domain-containing protein n=1 Tax=Scleropages formosus TaxID=113540 RepID=A0A8C9S7M9_SCLFO